MPASTSCQPSHSKTASDMTSCGTWSGFEQARPTTTRGHLRDRRASAAHLQRGDLSDGLVFDAVRVRLIEIGEAVKTLPEDLLTSEDPDPPGLQTRRHNS